MIYKGHLVRRHVCMYLRLRRHATLASSPKHGCSPGAWLRNPFIDKASRPPSMELLSYPHGPPTHGYCLSI
jgi:hypothetical protein